MKLGSFLKINNETEYGYSLGALDDTLMLSLFMKTKPFAIHFLIRLVLFTVYLNLRFDGINISWRIE